MTHPTDSALGPRPDLVAAGRGKLTFVERFNLRIVRASFQPGWFYSVLRFFQWSVGQAWIHHCTKHLRRVVGLDRIVDLNDEKSVIVVANHRSFFDMYVVTAELVRRKMRKRIAFLVRAEFFYDSILGLVVNFLMSFLAMYPPVFRERKKQALNALALQEMAWLLSRGGMYVGLHPEGTRKKDDDPYTFLPAKPGVGRIIQAARVPVVPVFINGLCNDLLKQVRGNFDGTGEPIAIVFGKPIDFGDLLDEEPSLKTHKAISEKCMEAIARLGEEEKSLRACGALVS